MKKELGIDPKNYSFHQADDKSTTLKHKSGHLLKIMHNVLSPKNQEILKALAPKDQPNEEQEQPMAEGGIAGEPCLNPNCKSHGKSHPNCRCYGYATGGEVGSVCKEKRGHHPVCEYYAEGSTDIQPTPEQQESNENAAQAKIQSIEQKVGYEKPNSTPTFDPRTWWAKGGNVPKETPDMMSCDQPFSKGGQARKMYADGAPPASLVANNDSTPDSTPDINAMTEKTLDEPPTGGSDTDIRTGFEKSKLGAKVSEGADWLKKEMQHIQDANSGQPQDQGMAQTQPMPVQQANPVQPAPEQTKPQPEESGQDLSQEQESGQPQPTPNAVPDMSPQQYHQMVANGIMDEANAWSKDLTDGKITPETYQSLFAKKDTLGKIGTIFGLLLSGAGSGLSHQPNALLGLMQKQIDNDLEAQKQSSANRQNYVRLAQQHAMNQAQQLTMAAGRKLTAAEAANINQEAALKANTLARIQATRAGFHKLTDDVNKMPQGSPQRQQAENALALLYQSMNNDNMDMADRFATARTLSNFGQAGTPTPGMQAENSFQQQNKALEMGGMKNLADLNRETHIPGVQGQASRAIPQDARDRIQAMNILDNKGKDVLNYVTAHRGTWNPQTRAVAAQKIEEMKNFYNDSIKGGALTQGRLGWYDEQFAKHPTDILGQLMGSTAKLNEMVNSNANRRDLELKNLGFPMQPGGNGNQPQGNEKLSKSGRPIIQGPDGKWRYK